MKRNSEIILYSTDDQSVKVEVYLEDETVWLTQKAIAELFDVVKSTISEHLTNIFESGELKKELTVRIFRTVQNEGKRKIERNLEYYNLDAIISVGYRVNSRQATKFRGYCGMTV